MRRLTAASLTGDALRPLGDALAPPVRAVDTIVAEGPTPLPEEARLAAIHEQARQAGLEAARQDLEAELARRQEELRAHHAAISADAMRTLEAERASMKAAAQELARAVEAHREQCEALAVEAAYVALTRILSARAGDRTLVADLCRQAIEGLRAQRVIVRLSPDDAAQLGPGEIDSRQVEVVADAQLVNGQCVVESERGSIDTGLDVRLEAIRRAFLASLAPGRGDA